MQIQMELEQLQESLSDIMDIEVSIDEVKNHYQGIYFVKEDFWCNINN